MPAPARAPERKRRWHVAVMGEHKRRGTWRIDEEIGAVAVMGDVLIDLREAEVRGNEIDITAVAVMGDIKIIVPDGVDVDLSGFAIMGERRVLVQKAPTGQRVPLIRVNGFVVMGGLKIIGDSQADPINRGRFAWSEWWSERRVSVGGTREQIRDLRRADHDRLRQLHRDAREQLREAHRDARDQLRDIRRGRIPRHPGPPEPPRW